MNVSRLEPPPPSQVMRVSKEGEDKEADFLALRLLNKRARVRLSPEAISLDSLPGKGALFAVANHAGLFAAAVRSSDGTHCLIASSLSDLRSAFSSHSSEEIPLSPRHSIQLPGTPNIVVFGFNETKLLVGLVQGQILVFDVPSLSSGSAPLHTFPSPARSHPRDILPNPEGMPSLVAVLYETDGSAGIESVIIFDLQAMQSSGGWSNGGTPETTPTSLSWSPKGKQLALGLQSGSIVTFSPTDTSKTKSYIPKPDSPTSQALISTTWLSNPDFFAIYIPQGPLAPDVEQSHLILSLDAKANTSTEVKLTSPYLPFPGMRPPGSFTAIFRNWDPAKFLIFVGDSTSSDIGLLGCTADPSGPHSESWTNFSLEETSTPTVPLDRDMNDTVLLGLSLDLTGTQTYNHKTASGEDSELPPPPVMYAYASDGTLVGWHILNLKGTPYPGMISASAPALATQQSSSIEMQASTEAVIKSPALSSGQPTTQPSSVFGQSSSLTAPSAFGQPPAPSAFGQNSFGQPSGFGAFSQSGTGGAFGQPSSLGATSTPPPFSTTPGSGFGAFASNEPSKFGQPTTGFGFGTGSGLGTLAPSTSNQPLASPMTLSMSASEEPMAAEADAGLGGLSLGGSSIGPGEAKPGFGTSGMFGTLAPAPADAAKTSTPAFGSATPFGGAIKPASGFGAFGNTGPSAFGQTSFGNPSIASTGSGSISTAPQTSSASPAFGAVGFGSATPSSAFGQSGFGQTSFGKSGFGQPAFGQSSLGSTPTTSAFGGGSGFSAFAQSGVSAFGTAANSGGAQAKPIWATSGNSTPVSEETKKTESVPSSSTFSAQSTPSAVGGFGGTIAPAFGATATPVKSEPSQESTTPASPPPKPANTTPDSSPFKSTGQAPATGAFANLTTSPGFGKFDSGFGAFGGASFSASSPFANPKPSVSSPFASTGSSTTSIFASSSSASPTKTGTGVAFGSTSALGSFGKSSTPVSAFPVPTPPTPGGIFGKSGFGDSLVGGASTTPPSTTKSGGFGAFASSSGGFASFAGGGTKTFSDLLKSSKDGDDDETDKGKERAQVEEKKAPVSVFSKLPPLPAKIEVPESPESVKSKGKRVDREEEEEEEEEGSSRGEEEGEEEEDDTGSFLSQSFSEGSEPDEELSTVIEEEEEEEPAGDEDEDEDEGDATPRDPAKVPLPLSRTPSLTRRSPTPSIRLTTPSPPSTPGPADKEQPKPFTREKSTTPPGSPAQEPSPLGIPAPSSVLPTGFSLGLGRPSTRPVRSSPLTSAPISGNEESEEEGSPRRPKVDTSEGVLKTGSATSKVPFGQMPSPSPSPKEDRSRSISPRPKTPPLLSTTVTKPSIFSAPLETPAVNKASPSPPTSLFPSFANPASTTTAKPNVFSSPFSGFGKPTTTPAPADDIKKSPSGSPPTSGGVLSGQQSLFGKLPTPPATVGPSAAPKPVSTTIFGQPTPLSTAQQPSAPGSGGFLGQKPASAPPTFNPPPASFFSSKPGASSFPAGGLLPPKPSSAPTTPGVAPTTGAPGGSSFGMSLPVNQPEPPAEIGMQTECANIYMALTKELEKLKMLTQEANQRIGELYKPTSGRRTITDIGDTSKWGVGDVHEFGRIMKGVEESVSELKESKIQHRSAIRQLESSMLRATTRKEEVVRFSKVSTDAELARILKARTLSPEHSETQSQLRRQIVNIRDRIRQLEEHLKGSKKRLHEMKTGKPALRAPSLDTINRTYNNIDLAITQQTDDITRLSSRMHRIKLRDHNSASSTLGTRDKRLPDDHRSSLSSGGSISGLRGPINVTPNVAATTAAALNAERAAQRLKKSLLRARDEPLLNKQAVDAPLAYTDFKTPQKLGSSSSSATHKGSTTATMSFDTPGWKGTFTLGTSTLGSLGSPSPVAGPSEEEDEESTAFEPIDSFGSAQPLMARHRGATKHHTKAVQLKKAPNPTGAGALSTASPSGSGPSGFSWGPLPNIAPKSTLSSDVRLGTGGSGGGLPFPLTGLSSSKPSPASSLSSSWVTDGFSLKK